MMDYFAMDGHGSYIWISYAIVAVTMIALFVVSFKGARDRDRELKELHHLFGGRRSRRGSRADRQ